MVLALVMYQAIRQIGGSWSGAAIALGVSILIARLLEPDSDRHRAIRALRQTRRIVRQERDPQSGKNPLDLRQVNPKPVHQQLMSARDSMSPLFA